MIGTDLDIFLDNLKWIISCSNKLICNNNFILAQMEQIESLYEELGFVRKLLEDVEETCHEIEKVKDLVIKFRDLAYEAEDIVDWFVVNAVIKQNGSMSEEDDQGLHCSLNLAYVMEEIKSIRAEVMDIEDTTYEIGVPQAARKTSYGSFSKLTSPVVEEKSVVGFDDEVVSLVDRLTRGKKQLDVISIVGMAGLGKTTLARKVYNDPLVAYYFHSRAWICVSQNYQKRDLLLGILNCLLFLMDKHQNSSDEKLCEEVYKCLKGRRYLIVIDDIWNNGAWDDLRRSFPDDNKGSRILLTSRLSDVVLHAKPGGSLYFLQFLTEEESWDLLREKVFGDDSCPPGLIETGMEIAKKCHGLPLAIVVIAGLLANQEKTRESWKQVAESVSSYISSEPTPYMHTIALSYNHLPHHLKACFLYLAAFPEDSDIPVRKLIWLWAAEGFIQKKGERSLDDIAEDCLIDLIHRSLVIVTQRKSNGGIKACRIHDLLRDFCLEKSKEENFLQQLHRSEQVSLSSSIIIIMNPRRLCIHPSVLNSTSLRTYGPHLRSLLGLSSQHSELPPKDAGFILKTFLLLRVLDLNSTSISYFPDETVHLIYLRYLALWAAMNTLPSSISNLFNLETLVVKGLSSRTILPRNIGKMINLRHLHIEGELYVPLVREPARSILFNLQTISTLRLSCLNEEVLLRIPNIRNLGCISWESSGRAFPKLDCLVHLETIKMSYRPRTRLLVTFPKTYKFPSNLKKLTLSGFWLPWTEMSTLGRLPNLQALKLLDNAFKGPQWETDDGEFLRLKFLKFQDLDIEQWNATSDHFPSLERLVLKRCIALEEIPCALGGISTLEMIETDWSSRSVVNSAWKIQKEQLSMGYDFLRIIIHTERLQVPQTSRHQLSRRFSQYDSGMSVSRVAAQRSESSRT